MAALRHQESPGADGPGDPSSCTVNLLSPVSGHRVADRRRRSERVCGEAAARWHAGSQPRMPPEVRPAMMLRWKIRKKTIVGIAAIADEAMIRFCVGAPLDDCQIPTFRVSLFGV